MAELTLASIDELEARMGREVDAVRASAALDDASALAHSETGDVWVDSTTGDLVADIPSVVVAIVCAAAQRVLSNPGGVTQEALGSFSQTHSNATTDVYFTRSERRVLRRAAGLAGIGSVTLESPYAVRNDDIYMSVAGPGEPDPIPMGPWPTSE